MVDKSARRWAVESRKGLHKTVDESCDECSLTLSNIGKNGNSQRVNVVIERGELLI